MSNIQDEAKRLLDIEGISGRALARRSGISRTMISNYRHGHKRLTVTMAARIVEGFRKLAGEMTPRVNNEND